MRRVMRSKFRNVCRGCGQGINLGDLINYYGKGRPVYHQRCPMSGENGSRRNGGLCEDAPCCGCCGPLSDSDSSLNYYGD